MHIFKSLVFPEVFEDLVIFFSEGKNRVIEGTHHAVFVGVSGWPLVEVELVVQYL